VQVDEAHRAAESRDAVGDAVLDALPTLAGVLDERRIHEPLTECRGVFGEVEVHFLILVRFAVRGISGSADRLREGTEGDPEARVRPRHGGASSPAPP
jgi:hypothetical protein